MQTYQASNPELPSPSPLRIVNALDIYEREFAPIKWFAKPILHEGATLLSGDPKVGKSFLALQIALAIAGSESTVLGSLPVENHGRVLYLAFDDGNERRLHDRLHQLTSDVEAIKNIDVVYRNDLPTVGTGLCDLVDQHLKHTSYAAVVLDTLGSVQSLSGNQNVYKAEYQETILLQKLAATHRICLLIVHHTNKSNGKGTNKAVNDPVGRASGSHGVTGAVDSVLLLSSSGGDSVTLTARPRDNEETVYSLRRLENGGWTIGEKPPAYVIDGLPGSKSTKPVCVTQDAVLSALCSGPKTKKELASMLGVSEEATRKRVVRMGKDKIQKLPDGRYELASLSGRPSRPAGQLDS